MTPALKTLVRRYTGFQFFFSLLLWIPIFYEYQKRVGLSDREIFGIQSIYYILFCVLEIPTGIAADRFGFRACLKASGVLLVGANLLPIFAPDYWGFLAHFFLIALSRSLVSGASSAYLYEAVLQAGESPALYKKAEGNARAYGLVGKVLLWPVAGWAMNRYLAAPYWMTTAAAVISVAFAWLLPEVSPSVQDLKESAAKWWSATGLRSVAVSLVRSPVLFWIMVQGVGVFVLSRILQVNLFQPILALRGFGVGSFGTIMAAATVFEATGSASSLIRWVGRRASDLGAVLALTIVLALSLVWISFAGASATVIALMVFSLAAGLVFPIQKQLMNDAISGAGASRYRATLLSVESIVDRAVCAGVAAVLGGIVEEGKMLPFLQASALVTVLMTAACYGLARAAIITLRVTSRVEPSSRQ